jgi:hypothetical protein
VPDDRDACPGIPGTATTGCPIDEVAPIARLVFDRLPTVRDLVRRGLPASVTCDEACRITAVLQVDRGTARRLRIARSSLVTIGQGQASMSQPGRARFLVRLNPRAKKRLRRIRRLTATLSIAVRDDAGNRRSIKRKVTLR